MQEEVRYVYYGESKAGRLLAIVVTERKEKIRVITAYDQDAGQRSDYLRRRLQGNLMKAKQTTIPVFKTKSEEADWWAGPAGRAFIKKTSAASVADQKRPNGSSLVSSLNKSSSVQIALRLPETDLAVARRIATRKGIGYQTLLKMLVHEGLERETQRH